MALPASASATAELADLLRSRRASLTPAAVGLPPGRRRRTTGLRREEVAQLAAISTTYYTYLEQGRDLRPSRDVLDALARALRLDPAERRHIHELAHGSAPIEDTATASRPAGSAVHALVDRMDPFPTYVKSPRWDLLAANRSARALFDDWSTEPGETPNMLWWMYTDPRARAVYADWESEATKMLGRFRMAAARHPDDPGFRDLVDRLLAASNPFRAGWERHEIRAQSSGQKQLIHPILGSFIFDHVVLLVADDPGQTLVTFALPDGDTTRLTQLAALATTR